MTPSAKILTVAPLPPSVTGGIEEYAYSVVASLRASGAQVTVLTSTSGPPASDPAMVQMPSKDLLSRPVCLRPSAYLRAFELCRDADTVHVHMPFPGVELFAVLCARLLGKPVVVTYHMDVVVDVPGTGERRSGLHRLLERVYARFSAVPTLDLAARVCTNTKAYALSSPLLRSRMSKVMVVHQGIDAQKLALRSSERAAEMRRDLLGDRYQRLVTFVGRFVPYKGLDYLLEAATRFKNEPVLFVLGGRGPLLDHVRDRIRALGLDNVRLLGFVPDEDMVNLFLASDVVVSPSVSVLESTPITLLYAMAVGTPVVGSEIGGTAESVPSDGRHGVIVPIENAEAIADAVRTLMSEPRVVEPMAHPRLWSDVASDYSRLFAALARPALRAPAPSISPISSAAPSSPSYTIRPK